MGLVLGKQYMHFFDRYWGWYNAPVLVGLIYLEFRRTLHQKYNLIAVGNARVKSRSNPIQQLDALRCVSGKFNYSTAGGPSESDTFFGRNVMPQVQTDKVLYHMTSNNPRAYKVYICKCTDPSTITGCHVSMKVFLMPSNSKPKLHLLGDFKLKISEISPSSITSVKFVHNPKTEIS